jgi:beta-lactamase regulating signal transducer with metallopeptidase domain
MNPLVDWYPGDAFTLAVLDVLAMITVLVALAWAAELTLARRHAALRGALCLAALTGVLLTPALTVTGRQLPWHVGLLAPEARAGGPAGEPPAPGISEAAPTPAGAPIVARSADVPRSAGTSGPRPDVRGDRRTAPAVPPAPARALDPRPRQSAVPEEPAPEAQAPAGLAPNPLQLLATVAFLGWGLGSVYLGVRLVCGGRRLRALWRRLRPLETERWADELTAVADTLSAGRLPRIFVSRGVRSPLVAGLVRPCVILPEALLKRCTRQQFRDILVHECAHVLRRDPWVRLLQRLAVVLFWVHPLVHLLNRRLDVAREEVCDNHVLAHADAPEYAETLLTVAQVCYPVPSPEGYVTMMPRHHNLERRVADLLEERRDTTTRLRAGQRWSVVTALFGILAAVSSIGLHGTAGAQGAKKAETAPREPSKEPASRAGAAKPADKAAISKVTGRVVYAADGKPLAGAEVRLIKRGHYVGQPVPRLATTNAQGEFTFEAVVPGEHRVLCFAGNLASRTRRYQGDIVTVAPDGTSPPVVLTMRPGITIRVKVLSETDGKPIAGARVRLIWTDTDRDHLTNARGEVELAALTPETWDVEATAKGHAAQVQVINMASGQPAALEMRLPPGGSLEGVVRDKQGQPVSGVGLNVYGSKESGTPLDYVETDAAGRYRFDYLPLGRNMKLYLAKLEYLTQTKEFRITPPAGSVARLDLTLEKRPHGGSVRGVVTDGKGKPVAGADLLNQGNSSNEQRRAKTDAAGKFLLDNVYSDGLGSSLVVKARGFAPQRVEFKPGPVDRPAEVTVQLEPGHRIKGRVVNDAGKPIRGVRVFYAHGNQHPGLDFGGTGTTDAQGRFQFDSLPANCPFAFFAEGYSQIPATELPLDGEQEVVVTIKAPGVIKGRVVDAATGKPIPRFNVRMTFSEDRQPGEPSAGLTSRRIDPGEDFHSAQGEFLVKDLLAGMPLQVMVAADGYRRHVLRRVEARPAGEADAVEIRLKSEDPAKLLTVRGKLVNHRGDPVRGAELRLIAATDRPQVRDAYPFNWSMMENGQVAQVAGVLQFQRLTTAGDGSFLFKRVPDDAEVELVYWGHGIPGGRVDHLQTLSEKERNTLVIKALPPARIVGTLDPKVFPEVGSIQVSGESRFFQAKVSADRKSFVVEDLPPGRFEIQVYGPPRRVEGQPGAIQQSVIGRQPVTLDEGKEAQVNLGQESAVPGGAP